MFKINKSVVKLAGFFLGAIASCQTVACLVQPINSSSRTPARATLKEDGSMILFNFTQNDDLSNWVESSDTVRTPGMSKATFVIQKTQLFQRAIFFALLNPQPNGAGFAGVRTETSFDLSGADNLQVKLRAQGENRNFKIVLRHHGQVGDSSPSYETFFEAPRNELTTIELPLSEFKPYWRGQALNETQAPPLDKADVTSFGFQLYGGVYSAVKQSGPSTLEIDWVKAVKKA